MEAGLEHLSRGTGRHLSRFVAVLEPYYRSMETARRVALLARELGIDDVVVLSNKVRDDADRQAIADFCAAHNLKLVGEVPYDASLIEIERRGEAPVEQRPPGSAVTAIQRLVDVLA
jgi:CO dehydrogenase maturation factor